MTDEKLLGESGVLGIGEDERDLIAGEDIDIRKLKSLKKQDRIWKATDQSYGDYTHACTMMSTYGGILSIFNVNSKEEEKDKIIAEAKDNGYVVGTGWRTRLGVKTACKVWNTLHKDKQVIYLRTTVGSEQFKVALEKGFPIVMSYRTSNEYFYDRYKDGVIDGKSFDNYTGGHAICTFGSERGLDWEHVNTYPKIKYNEYGVRHGYDLVKDMTYYPGCFILIPKNERNIEELKKRKLIKIYMELGERIKKMSYNPKTFETIEGVNTYFKSVGF